MLPVAAAECRSLAPRAGLSCGRPLRTSRRGPRARRRRKPLRDACRERRGHRPPRPATARGDPIRPRLARATQPPGLPAAGVEPPPPRPPAAFHGRRPRPKDSSGRPPSRPLVFAAPSRNPTPAQLRGARSRPPGPLRAALLPAPPRDLAARWQASPVPDPGSGSPPGRWKRARRPWPPRRFAPV